MRETTKQTQANPNSYTKQTKVTGNPVDNLSETLNPIILGD